ncbi:RNA pyrophosphohydrolase [Xinfangfangia sp. CPCC 101601]|uniref:RNA pyrophosphohydrolase n=1 Tax=Pseudogemmobacter lacusdianii TaxID=3069608 RepID=A0ABU0VXH0_9RHOB|nr:RNA pyrophosphohydrolase [Xinfangfangia sp. CPCC 101601]MDQ2066451.1 RNA pyrophosphohydrolase [Xinfangfangia sp. CPCC 101601]
MSEKNERKGPAGLPYRPCVGVMLVNDDGLIFAGQRKDSAVAAWQMPQGGIDAGEKPREAAYRELWEETGVSRDLVDYIGKTHGWITYDLPAELLGRVWGGKFGGQRQKWFLLRYRGSDDQIRIDTEHPEFESWRWIDADALLESIVPFKRAVYDSVIRSFRAYLA